MVDVAQLVEQLTLNQLVVGSIPTRPTIQGRSKTSSNVHFGEKIARNCLESRPEFSFAHPWVSIAIQWQPALGGGIFGGTLRRRSDDAPKGRWHLAGTANQRPVSGKVLSSGDQIVRCASIKIDKEQTASGRRRC